MDRTLVVLTGAAGAGKTTVAAAVEAAGLSKKLKPFTTRPQRHAAEDEYHFLSDPPAASDIAWIIDRPHHHYGMLKSELDGLASGELAITVFEPTSLEVLKDYQVQNPNHEVVVIGLDTISTADQQAQRVGGDAARQHSQRDIDAIRGIVAKQDVTLRGDVETIIAAVSAICRILSSRGGVVTKNLLEPLLAAGTLLKNHEPRNLQSASYDLRVGDEVWCQGAFHDLSPQQPLFKIPPYSYAIVKAREVAMLPSFLIGQFDIKVSHFLSGIILSNGPQVDPGYEGDLFCMLFNGSSSERPLRMDDHFSTIQFVTTATSGERYDGQYSLTERLRRHMPPEAAVGPGGEIFSRIEKAIEEAKIELRSEMPKDRLVLFGILFAVVTAVSLAAASWAVVAAMDATRAALEARGAAQILNSNQETNVSRTGSAKVRGTGETTSKGVAAGDDDPDQPLPPGPASEGSSQLGAGWEGAQPGH